jgi:hypothetical protein
MRFVDGPDLSSIWLSAENLTKAIRQEVEVSGNDQRPEAGRAVGTGPPNGGSVVAPGGGAAAPAHGGTVVTPTQAGVGVNSGTVVSPSPPGAQAPPAETAPMNQQQPPPQGPSNPGWQQPQQPGPQGPGWQQPQQPGYGPPPTQPGPGGPGYGGPPPGGPGYGGPGYGGPPPGRGGGSKAGLFIALGVVALLVVGGVAFALTRGGNDEPEPVVAQTTAAPESPAPPTSEAPSPVPTPTEDTETGDLGAFPNQFEQDLLSHLPEDFIDQCSRLEFELPQTANAAITCTPNGADFIGYVQYDRFEPMNRDYNSSVRDQGVIRNSGSAGCQNGSPAEGTYTRGNKSPGRLMCYFDGDEAWMDWTHDTLSIYTFASRSDGNLKKLFNFWVNAGPFGRPIPID